MRVFEIAPTRRPWIAPQVRRWLVVVTLSGLSACGGGSGSDVGYGTGSGSEGGGSSTGSGGTLACAPPPEGLQPLVKSRAAVGGTLEGASPSSFILLQSPDLRGWGFDRVMMYGSDFAAKASISGVVYSDSSGYWCNNPNGAMYNGGDNQQPVYLRADVVETDEAATLASGGSLRYPQATYTLAATTLPGIEAGYALTSVRLNDVAGAWTLKGPLNDSLASIISMEVSAGGNFTMTARGCTYSGTFSPPSAGLFTINAREDGDSCVGAWSQGLAWVGLALAYPLAAGGWQLLAVLTANNGFDSATYIGIGRR